MEMYAEFVKTTQSNIQENAFYFSFHKKLLLTKINESKVFRCEQDQLNCSQATTRKWTKVSFWIDQSIYQGQQKFPKSNLYPSLLWKTTYQNLNLVATVIAQKQFGGGLVLWNKCIEGTEHIRELTVQKSAEPFDHIL